MSIANYFLTQPASDSDIAAYVRANRRIAGENYRDPYFIRHPTPVSDEFICGSSDPELVAGLKAIYGK